MQYVLLIYENERPLQGGRGAQAQHHGERRFLERRLAEVERD